MRELNKLILLLANTWLLAWFALGFGGATVFACCRVPLSGAAGRVCASIHVQCPLWRITVPASLMQLQFTPQHLCTSGNMDRFPYH